MYLCIKTVERAHTPKAMWQKIRLSAPLVAVIRCGRM